MAFFNGYDMGIVEEYATSLNPKEKQQNAYPGVDGLEVIDMGGRGGTSYVGGVLGGVDEADLTSIQNTFRDLQADGGAYPFVDDSGYVWPDVILEHFRPVGPRLYLISGEGGVAQRFTASFLHING